MHITDCYVYIRNKMLTGTIFYIIFCTFDNATDRGTISCNINTSLLELLRTDKLPQFCFAKTHN